MISPVSSHFSTGEIFEGAGSFRFRLYICYVAGLKLFFGATAWEGALRAFDKIYISHISLRTYILRCIVIGVANATFSCLGAIFSNLAEFRKMNSEDWVGTFQLWGAAFISGFVWQPETDFAGYLSGGVFMMISPPTYSLKEIGYNFVVFAVAHTIIFSISCRTFQARWAEKIIDWQVGIGGFGFYVAAYFGLEGDLLVSFNAGAWTAAHGAVAAIPPLVYLWWRDKIYEEAGGSYKELIAGFSNGYGYIQISKGI